MSMLSHMDYIIENNISYDSQRTIKNMLVMTPKTTQASALISNHREVHISQSYTEIDCPV